MSIKDYLKQYKTLDREIDRLLEEQQRWKDLALRVTPGYEGAVPTGSPDGNRIPTAVERIAEWEEKIDRKVDQLVALREEIEGMVSELDNKSQREILIRRYIFGQKWEHIAVAMHLEYRWVLRIHGRALQKLTIKSHPEM